MITSDSSADEENTTDVRKFINRIRQKALGVEVNKSGKPLDCSAVMYGSSEEDEAMVSATSEKMITPLQTAGSIPQKISGRTGFEQKLRGKRKLGFRSEMEFFLHYLWSQKGLLVEDQSDEYYNLTNPQSTEMMQADFRKHDSAFRATQSSFLSAKDVKPVFYRQQKDAYTKRVPLSFNFKVPSTIVMTDGKPKRWYYSNEMGQLKIQNANERDWSLLVKDRLEDMCVPSMVMYKLESSKKNAALVKDFMSALRTNQCIKSVAAAGFPKEFHMVQEMVQSANLKPPTTSLTPTLHHPKNVSPHHEVFEVQWDSDGEYLRIFRLFNVLKNSKLHIASSKTQIDNQIKPIRLKHGTINPAKALLLKLNIPQQLLYLSHEEQQAFAQRQQIWPDKKRRVTQFRVEATKLSNATDAHLPSDHIGRESQSNNSGRNSAVLQQALTSHTSPKLQKLAKERQQLFHVAEELEAETQTAIRLIRAQFMLHQLRIQKATFFFQWVHQEKDGDTHEPTKAIKKRLYLVYVQDLQVLDKQGQTLPLTRRAVKYHRDALAHHLYTLVRSHAELRLLERKHQDLCSCQIQMDLQQKVTEQIQDIFVRMQADQTKIRDRFKHREPTILNALEVLFNIDLELQEQQQQVQNELNASAAAKSEQLKELNVERDGTCAFCGDSLLKDDQKWSLPLAHLVYMPNQEQYIDEISDSLPSEQKEKLLFSAKELPPFLRILIPKVRTVEQFQRLQQDKLWLNQEVPLSRQCYQKLARRIVFLARQGERLQQIQTDFQKQMLKIIRRDKSQTKTSRRQSAAESSSSANDSKRHQTSQHPSPEHQARHPGSGQSPGKPIIVKKEELYQHARQLGIVVQQERRNGEKRATTKQIMQQISAKQASQGLPIQTFQLQKKTIEVSELDDSDRDEINKLMQMEEHSSLKNLEVEMEIRGSRAMSRSDLQQKVLFTEAAVSMSSIAPPSTTRLNARSSDKSGQVNPGRGNGFNMQLNLNHTDGTDAQRREKFEREKFVMGIVNPKHNILQTKRERQKEQQSLLNRMRERGDATFAEQEHTAEALELSVRKQIRQPLFQGIPQDPKAHFDLKKVLKKQKLALSKSKDTLEKGSSRARIEADRRTLSSDQLKQLESPRMFDSSPKKTTQQNNSTIKSDVKAEKKDVQKPQRSHRALVASEPSKEKPGDALREDILVKLLKQHAPDYRPQPKTARSQQETETEELQGLLAQEKQKFEDQERQRRKALVDKIKQLKEAQTSKTIEMLNTFQRKVSIRESQWRNPSRLSSIGQIMNDGGDNPSAEQVAKQMPGLVEARSMQNFEITRLTKDPIFGQINQQKIMNADRLIRENRVKEDPRYQEAMRVINKRIKHPVTEEDFAIRRERRTVEECEDLLQKMDAVLQADQFNKPAATFIYREFTGTTRLASTQVPLKTTAKKQSKKARQADRLVSDAEKAINFIERIRQREKDIAIEEELLFQKRRISSNLTLLEGKGDPTALPVEANLLKIEKPRNEIVASLSQRDHSQAWVYNPRIDTSQRSTTRPRILDTLGSEGALELIRMQHQVNEQDAQNSVTLAQSARALSNINLNIKQMGRMLGRSQTVGSLPKLRLKKKKRGKVVYRNTLGLTVEVGSGRATVVAKDQHEASFIFQAKQHMNFDNFKLNDLFP